MRKIKVEKWTSNGPDGKVEEDILKALSIIISGKDPKELPKGLEKFRIFGRISKAFEKATETNELVLEESDYDFLKNSIVRDVPSVWAMNHKLREAIESFMEAKEISG